MGGRDSGYKEKGKLFSPEEKQIPLEDKETDESDEPRGDVWALCRVLEAGGCAEPSVTCKLGGYLLFGTSHSHNSHDSCDEDQ